MTTKKSGGAQFEEKVKKSANRIWLAGLGAFALAEEEGSKLFRSLVSKGEGYEEQGKAQFDRVRERVEVLAEAARDKVGEVADEVKEKAGAAWGKVGDDVDGTLSAALHKVGVPTKAEINRLTRRIEELTALVEKKVARPAARPAAKQAAARKPAAKKSTARKKS